MPTPTSSRVVPISELRLDHPHWQNPRLFTGLDDDGLAEFGKELKERGILDPITVQKVKVNGSVIDLVIDGQRRLRAGLGVFPKSHKIEVKDRTAEPIELTWEEADEIMFEVLAMGQHRDGLSSYELSEVAEKMRNRDRTLADIARSVRKSESWVSKILKARHTASPKLMLAWKKGDVTDEQFKDMATVKEEGDQAAAVDDVKEARKAGDKTEARIRAKEHKEKAVTKAKADKPSTKAKETPAPNGKAVVASGDQTELWQAPPPVKKKSPPAKVALEQMLELAERRAPVHDYVKGIMDAVRYALDETAIEGFGKPWRQYLSRIDGLAAPKKSAKARPVRKPGGKARRSKNDRPRAAKAGKKKGRR